MAAGAGAAGCDGAAAGAVAARAGVVACAVTGVSCGLVFFFAAWCVGAGLGMAVWVSVAAATGEALPACRAFPPLVALAIPPMMISAARPPSTVRTLCRRGHNVRGGRP